MNEGAKTQEQLVSELTGKGFLTKGSAPFIRDRSSTSKIMLQPVIAMLPALIIAGVVFGGGALMLTGVTIISAMVAEAVFSLILRHKNTVSDLSCVVTGMVVAYALPATVPYFVAILAAFLAVGSKHLFGGLGKNILNGAAFGLLVVTLCFNKAMTMLPEPYLDPENVAYTASPLVMKEYSYYDLFMGSCSGGLGEVSALALLLGLFYLVFMRAASLHIPLTYVGTVAVFAAIAGENPLYQVMAGTLLLGAVFMASDPVTTPMTGLGKVIFGLGCGIITGVLRYFTPFTEGVIPAILVMNILVPLIDRLTVTKPVAARGQKK